MSATTYEPSSAGRPHPTGTASANGVEAQAAEQQDPNRTLVDKPDQAERTTSRLATQPRTVDDLAGEPSPGRDLGTDQSRTRTLSDEIATLQTSLAMASRAAETEKTQRLIAEQKAQVSAATVQAEQARSATLASQVESLQRSVAATREELERPKAAARQQVAAPEAELSTAAQSEVQAADFAKQLDVERTRAARLDQDLAAARAQAALEKTEAETLLQAAQQAVAVLKAKLATATQAGAQAVDFKNQLDHERTRAAGLAQDLATAQAEAARINTEDDTRRQAADAASREAASRLEAVQKQVATLEAKLSTAAAADTQAADLGRQLDVARARAARLDQDLAAAQAQAAHEKTEAEAHLQAASQEIATRSEAAQQALAILRAKLATAAQAGAQAADFKDQRDRERARAAGLAQDLATMQTDAARAKADGETRLQDGALASKEAAARIEAAEKTVATLQSKLSAAATAGARAADLGKQLDVERTRAASLDQDLANLRTQVARNDAVSESRRQVIEATAQEAATRMQAAERHAVVLEAALARAEASQHAGLAERSESATPRPNLSQAPGHAGRTASAAQAIHAVADEDGGTAADHGPDAAAGTSPAVAEGALPKPPALRSTPSEAGSSGSLPGLPVDALLPTGVQARVVMRYAMHSEAARLRASAVGAALRARGLDVADPVESNRRFQTSRITFFYAEDLVSARSIAGILGTFGQPEAHSSITQPLPRPGTIEVSIAG